MGSALGVLSFEGNGIFKEYEGGYADWLRSQKESSSSELLPSETAATASKPLRSRLFEEA